jgi:hypothetical protein
VAVQQRVVATTKDLNSTLELAFAWTELAQIETHLKAEDAACRAFHQADALYHKPGSPLDGRHVEQARFATQGAAGCRAHP